MKTSHKQAASAVTGLSEKCRSDFSVWANIPGPAQNGSADGTQNGSDALTRRHFMKIMSASFLLAGAGLTGCRRPVEKIVPFSRLPEGYVHGTSQYYATAMPVRESAIPLLVRSHEGRPVKIEGNSEHPDQPFADEGKLKHIGTDAHAQAAVLSLYDPDRARRCAFKGTSIPQRQAFDLLARTGDKLSATKGTGLHFLCERSSSPSRARLARLAGERFPRAAWYVHEPVDFDIHREAATLLFGVPVRPVYRLEHAHRILSLDCDFLGTEANAHRMISGFVQRRRPAPIADKMNRLYVVESLFTLTGANADHRLSLPPQDMVLVSMLLYMEMGRLVGAAKAWPGAMEFWAELRKRTAKLSSNIVDWAAACMADLVQAGQGAVVLAGYRQPLAVHLLAHAMNVCLGSTNGSVVYLECPVPEELSISELAAALDAGAVDTLVILGGNPAYTAPADLDWVRTQRKAGTVIRLGEYEDETFPVTDLHLPKAHFLESWGDARTGDGTVVPIQPLIAPLFDGLTELEVLARLCRHPVTGPYEIVRETFRAWAKPDTFEERWHSFLHDGFMPGSAPPPVTLRAPNWSVLVQTVLGTGQSELHDSQDLAVVFARDYRIDDGRHANNGWLQELPDPITKIAWDNVIAVGPATALKLGLHLQTDPAIDNGAPVARLEIAGRSVEGPVWVQPGMAENTVAVPLGYGRSSAGRVGNGVGFNAYSVRLGKQSHISANARLIKTGRKHPIACTQPQASMQGRSVVREAVIDRYDPNPDFAKRTGHEHARESQSLYSNPFNQVATGALHQWAMAIDLSLCVGCGACVLACQSENNVPIVGKSEVLRRREMHWLRLDRYYSGPAESLRMAWQPMLCQHCEAAPCESVCPVNATTHNDEGLNVMSYHRCVGTRYCSNNCPFKVRRFNFFDYHRRPLDRLEKSPLVGSTDGQWEVARWFRDPDRGSRPMDEWELIKLSQNPDVTVRMRGVMEKCTFCVQRIEQAKTEMKIHARASADVTVPNDSFQTACQQACPAGAIVFGNLNSKDTHVSRAIADPRVYRMLEHLNLRQRVVYLARVRNPNPALPDCEPGTVATAGEEWRQNEVDNAEPGLTCVAASERSVSQG